MIFLLCVWVTVKINVFFIYRQGHKHHQLYGLLLNHIHSNVPLQGNAEYITGRQIEGKGDAERASTHNARMGKKQEDDFIKLLRAPFLYETPHGSTPCLQSSFLVMARNHKPTNMPWKEEMKIYRVRGQRGGCNKRNLEGITQTQRAGLGESGTPLINLQTVKMAHHIIKSSAGS